MGSFYRTEAERERRGPWAQGIQTRRDGAKIQTQTVSRIRDLPPNSH